VRDHTCASLTLLLQLIAHGKNDFAMVSTGGIYNFTGYRSKNNFVGPK